LNAAGVLHTRSEPFPALTISAAPGAPENLPPSVLGLGASARSRLFFQLGQLYSADLIGDGFRQLAEFDSGNAKLSRETPALSPTRGNCRTFLQQTLCILVQQPTPEFQPL